MSETEKPTRSRASKIEERDPHATQEALGRQIATLALSGMSIASIAKQLAVTPAAVRRITETDRYKELVSTTAEEELGPALSRAKAGLARLAPKAVRAIEKALDEGSARDALQAATIVLKSVGLHEEKEAQQDQSITIVMPSGLETPTTIEVKNDDDSALV